LVGRVPAAEIEALVVAALRSHLSASSAGEQLPAFAAARLRTN
jgi:hypothetical protein